MRGNNVIRAAGKLLLLSLAAFFLLGSVLPDSPYKMPCGGSRWRVGKNSIIANIDLNESLLSDMRGMKEKHYNYASGSDAELKKIATEFIQPYVNKKITVSVNGRIYQVKVDKLIRNDNAIYTIWLSVSDIAFDRPLNNLKINYRMLFEELKDNHINLAFFYRSDASDDALQKVFDNIPAEGQYEFTNNSPAWELSIPGTATPPQPPTPVRGNREMPPGK